MNKNNQKGYAPIFFVYTLLFLIVVGTIGFSGYYVYTFQKDKEMTSEAPKTTPPPVTTPTPPLEVNGRKYSIYTDTANKYTTSYPSDWSIAYAESDTANDWTKNSRTVYFVPPKLELVSGRFLYITLENAEYCSQDFINALAKDMTHSSKLIKVNDVDYAIYDIHRFNGPVESYISHDYFVPNSKKCYHVAFRENYTNKAKNISYDNKSLFADFEYIASSIKFTTPSAN